MISLLLFTFVSSVFAAIDCRYNTTTSSAVNYYTCTEISQKYRVAIEDFYSLNPALNTDCSNILPNTNYCVDGTIGFAVSKDGFCGPSHGNTSCKGYSGGQCCNSETWKCGKALTDCQAGTCYEGGCLGFPTEYSLNGTCGTQNGNLLCGGKWGTCCNKSGKCGSGTGFCDASNCQSGNCSTLAPVTTKPTLPWQVGTSQDGTCGGAKGFTCGVVYGNCCSASGICSSLDSDCGTGCQPAFGTCKNTTTPSPTPGTISPDGSCAGTNGYVCAGSSFGSCCSSNGFCGSTTAHCNAGCQSAFGNCTTTDLSPDGTCGGTNKFKCAGSGFGDCCSASGFCGSTSAHCTAGCQSSFGTCTATGLSPDGTCGGTNKYKCAGSGFGDCCSPAGFCGSTSAHCGSGCQSTFGTCTSTNMSPDGSCGGTNKYTCQGTSFGNCCSQSGFCGSTTAHCTAGCQASFGTCTSTDISPDGTCGGTNKYKCVGSAFGNCCSPNGFCGSTTDHCGTGCQLTYGTCAATSTSSQAPKPTDISTDGACGANKKKCGGSGFGDCCSATGFCGNTVNHCAQGCQTSFSTACLTSNIPTLDGSCGATKGGYTCAGGPFNGNCCSAGGFCGTTTDHCGTGCQKSFGKCT